MQGIARIKSCTFPKGEVYNYSASWIPVTIQPITLVWSAHSHNVLMWSAQSHNVLVWRVQSHTALVWNRRSQKTFKIFSNPRTLGYRLSRFNVAQSMTPGASLSRNTKIQYTSSSQETQSHNLLSKDTIIVM